MTTPVLRAFLHNWSFEWVNGLITDSSESVGYSWINQNFEMMVEVNSEDGVTDPNFSNGRLSMAGVPLAADQQLGPIAQSFSLRQNYPNPFNASTTIAYDLPKAGHMSLRVFDLLGRETAVLKDGFVEAGSHRMTFDGSNLTSGIYFVRLDAGAFSQTKKLMLLK